MRNNTRALLNEIREEKQRGLTLKDRIGRERENRNAAWNATENSWQQRTNLNDDDFNDILNKTNVIIDTVGNALFLGFIAAKIIQECRK